MTSLDMLRRATQPEHSPMKPADLEAPGGGSRNEDPDYLDNQGERS